MSVRPSILPSVPPRWPSRPQIYPPSPKFSPPGLKSAFQASNQPPPTSNLTYRPQICPPDLQLGLQASNQPSVAQICPAIPKSALQALILPSSPQICLQWPKLAPRTDGRLEIPPVFYRTSALWGRCPALTPLLQLSLQAGHRVPLTMCDPWMTSYHYPCPPGPCAIWVAV